MKEILNAGLFNDLQACDLGGHPNCNASMCLSDFFF